MQGSLKQLNVGSIVLDITLKHFLFCCIGSSSHFRFPLLGHNSSWTSQNFFLSIQYTLLDPRQSSVQPSTSSIISKVCQCSISVQGYTSYPPPLIGEPLHWDRRIATGIGYLWPVGHPQICLSGCANLF